MVKLLHAADLHLDSAFSALPPEKAAQRRAEQRLVLERLTALSEGCAAVLLAGDLFDSARVYRDTLEALRAALAACRCPVFIAPGNHDALLPGSPYLENGWPENVHIFRTAEPERISLPELDVYGAGFLRAEMPAMLDNRHIAKKTPRKRMLLVSTTAPLAPITAISAVGFRRKKFRSADFRRKPHSVTISYYSRNAPVLSSPNSHIRACFYFIFAIYYHLFICLIMQHSSTRSVRPRLLSALLKLPILFRTAALRSLSYAQAAAFCFDNIIFQRFFSLFNPVSICYNLNVRKCAGFFVGLTIGLRETNTKEIYHAC